MDGGNMGHQRCIGGNVLYRGMVPLVYGSELVEELEYFTSRGLMGVNVDNLGGFYATWGSTAYVMARKMESRMSRSIA